MKKITSILFIVFLLSFSSLKASESNGEESMMEQSRSVCPFNITSVSYYVPNTTNYDVMISKRGEFTNKTSVTQSKQISFSRTVSTSVSAGGSSELNIIGQKLKVHAEVKAGVSKTETETSVFNVPPHSTIHYEVGSKRVNTSGKIETWDARCNKTVKNIKATYTYSIYDNVY